MAKNFKNDKQADAVERGAIAFFKGIGQGIKALRDNLILVIIFCIITLACGVIFVFRQEILARLITDEGFHVLQILLPGIVVFPVLVLYIFGTSSKTNAGEFDERFAQIKFCNKAGIYPTLIKKETSDKKIIYSFKSLGIALSEWRARKVELEVALDCNIVKFEQDKNTKQIIQIHTVPASTGIPTNIVWENEFIRREDFEIVTGMTLLDNVNFDLCKYPHALIAGVTGSGKSVILRCMLWQCIVKGAKAFMIDFKGGVEFTAFEDYGEVITDRENALELLKELTAEMKSRLAAFKNTGVKDLQEYNKKYSDNELCRIVIVCDEIAEMLDKTGLSKADSAIYYEIEKELSSIARPGRAPGIHMLLATQRPDAKVIVGQIKNNLPIRISGRMTDPQASEMVLGSPKATEIPAEVRGRFMYNVGSDTYEFQAYIFQDKDIKRGDYQKGGMLITSGGVDAPGEDVDEEYDEYESVDDIYDSINTDIPNDNYKGW